MDTPSESQKPKFSKWALVIVLGFFLVWPLMFGVYWLAYKGYTAIDPAQFPWEQTRMSNKIKSIEPGLSEAEKGVFMTTALSNRLERELDSTLGWSVNDLVLSPTRHLDNRAYRQRGTIFATRMLMTFYSTNLAKYGTVDAENELLKEAREKYFAFSEDSWWFPASEGEYKKGLKLLREYEKRLSAGQAVYNMRTDDMYNFLTFITGKQMLDQPFGLLVQTNDEVPYIKLDDRIYYTQGVILVLRDLLQAFVALYPEIKEKGGEENIKIAFRDMEQICTFDPLVVMRGDHDAILADHRGKMARYLISMRERINDLSQSIRR